MNSFNIVTSHFPVSHLAKLIISLIVLSFKHQNPQGGLDALSAPEPSVEQVTIAVHSTGCRIDTHMLLRVPP
jgi:hypothetical protein